MKGTPRTPGSISSPLQDGNVPRGENQERETEAWRCDKKTKQGEGGRGGQFTVILFANKCTNFSLHQSHPVHVREDRADTATQLYTDPHPGSGKPNTVPEAVTESWTESCRKNTDCTENEIRLESRVMIESTPPSMLWPLKQIHL